MLTRQERMVVFFLIGASIAGLGILYYRNFACYRTRPELVEGGKGLQDKPRVVCVDVTGAVWRPGVYKLERGARVGDVLEKAMLRPDADVDALNRALVLSDGQKIIVPAKGISSGRKERSGYAVRINLNTATESELRGLPNVGIVRSRDIVNYRKMHGPFTAVEELKNVPGIGDKTFRQLKDKVVVK